MIRGISVLSENNETIVFHTSNLTCTSATISMQILFLSKDLFIDTYFIVR